MPALDIKHHYPLKALNTFGLEVYAETYFNLCDISQIKQALDQIGQAKHYLLLGGGSNILFIGNYEGTIVRIALKGKKVLEQDERHVYLKLGAGEIWHEAVLFCLANSWGGLENLSLIPGTVGAAPIQNIGAYGVELKDCFYELEGIELSSGKTRTYRRTDCAFGYRDSIFKQAENQSFLITSVTLRLELNGKPALTHEAVKQQLKTMKKSDPTIQDVGDAVIAIRQQKLPDPAEMGNAGSFFKNPIVPNKLYHSLQTDWHPIPGYRVSDSEVKIPAGWLIEQAGWKGRVIDGRCGVHDRQALVLVNYGTASGRDILNLSTDIVTSVRDTFGILLEREVNVIGHPG